MKKILFVVALIFLFSYLMNFSWEAFHAVYLYAEHNVPAEVYVPMLHYVSTMDGGERFYGSFLWITTMGRKAGITFFFLGLVIAAIIEYRAVYIYERWSYNPKMPTILGIGISPLIQLSITGLISLWIVVRLISRKK